MTEVNFKPLFKYLDEKFGEVDENFNNLRSEFSTLQSSVDGIGKQINP